MSALIKKIIRAAICAVVSVSAIVFTVGAGQAGEKLMLCPGGMPFGVKIMTDGLLVVGFSGGENGDGGPAYDAGLRKKDIILKINDKDAVSSEIFLNEIENSGGAPVTVVFRRGDEEKTVTVTPKLSSENKYKLGMWLRDSTAGIGTVTFFNEMSGAFGGLGHGICDGETGELLPLRRGTVTDVTINGITKGQSGTPGELSGYFVSEKRGTLIGNTESGVYGAFTIPPEGDGTKVEADSSEIREGDATILCTLDDNCVKEYSVTISDISKNEKSKNFVVTVTDKALLAKTGGIVQGMSGSPVLQDGKLVGAVTHVLVSDPSRGYGIFIENMLEGMPDLLK